MLPHGSATGLGISAISSAASLRGRPPGGRREAQWTGQPVRIIVGSLAAHCSVAPQLKYGLLVPQ